MGLGGPRTPAVHRAARILDAIATGDANTPAALSGALGLAKSSIADLVGALENDGLIGRSVEGHLHVGPRWAALSDPDEVVDRLLSACARAPELDGHTVSIVHLFGNQIICLDVRSGRYPLPLTPRPGQRTMAEDSAGAIAILSSVPLSEAAELVRARRATSVSAKNRWTRRSRCGAGSAGLSMNQPQRILAASARAQCRGLDQRSPCTCPIGGPNPGSYGRQAEH